MNEDTQANETQTKTSEHLLSEGELEKRNAPKVKKSEYVVAASNLKCDGKTYKRGEPYTGKLYANLLAGKRPKLVKASAWENR